MEEINIVDKLGAHEARSLVWDSSASHVLTCIAAWDAQ